MCKSSRTLGFLLGVDVRNKRDSAVLIDDAEDLFLEGVSVIGTSLVAEMVYLWR